MGKFIFTTPASPYIMCLSWFMGKFFFLLSWLRHSRRKIPSLFLHIKGLGHSLAFPGVPYHSLEFLGIPCRSFALLCVHLHSFVFLWVPFLLLCVPYHSCFIDERHLVTRSFSKNKENFDHDDSWISVFRLLNTAPWTLDLARLKFVFIQQVYA